MGFLDYKGLERFLKNSREEFAQKNHTHDERYYTEYEIDNKLSKKSGVDHIHDDRYYTEAEVDGKLEKKSSTDHTHDLSELISNLSIGTSTTLNDAVQIITQDTDTANQKYYRRPLAVLWDYIKSKADSVYSAIGHNHKIQNLEDYTTRVWDATIVRQADTVLASPQDKDGIATFRKLDKNDVGLENVDNTADKNKNVATAGIATTGVRDYNNANNTIKIGWQGADLDAKTLAYVAGYTSDKKIHPASKDGVRSWLGLGDSAYKNTKSRSNKGSTDWTNNATDDAIVPTMSFMAYWDGAYNSNGASNLSYCDRGRFGTIVTKNTGDYAVAGHTHSFIDSVGAKNAQTGRNQIYGNVYSYNSNASAHTGMPITYTSTIGFGQGAAGTVEICGEWTGGKGLWSRALRDCCDDWYGWQRIYTENYHPSADVANKANSADYLNFTAGNEINFTGTPQNNTVYFGYRNTSINEYKFNNGNSSGGLASITAAAFNGKATSAGTADSATTLNMNSAGSGNSIYGSGKDAVNGPGGGLNNVVISSWYGVSFTSPCGGGGYGGKNQTAVGIDCREGIVKAARFDGSLNGTASNAKYLGNDAAYMRMHWAGKGGQPTWLWGGNDASNMYVWNPSNFSVNYANSAGNGVTASGKTGAGIYYVRFGNGTQMCWGFYKESDHSGSTSFPVAFNNSQYSISLTVTVSSNNAPYITGRSTTSFSYARHGTSYNDVQWIAVGTWK